jgi:hypothetical protein
MKGIRWTFGITGALAIAVACGTNGGNFGDAGGGNLDGSSSGASSGASGSGGPDGIGFGDTLADVDQQCDAPDMLIVLDHTDSMSQTPQGTRPANTPQGHATTKWVLACDAVKALVASPADMHSRFGLELFPLDPQVITDAGGTGSCKTLTQLLAGGASTNTSCQPAEVLVPPALSTGAAIQGILDPETLRLCVSTPIAKALATAAAELASVASPSRKQFVVLVTDGGETCKGDVVGATQALATAGVNTYAVGFGSADAGSAGVNVGLLDDVACAGMTAANFATSCVKMGNGYVAKTHAGPPLFYLAEDGTSLQQALESIQTATCCGCAQ